MNKPHLFIGSSSENLLYGYALQDQLKASADVRLWNQGVFELNSSYLDGLTNELNDCDFGVFIFAPDDILKLRSQTHVAVRDNVLFEFGLFMGKLGKERVFFVVPQEQGNFRLPSDLLGLSTVTFDTGQSSVEAALGPVCFKILQAISKVGIRQGRLVSPSIERERQRVSTFCARVAGAWWERIGGEGMGLFQIQMDELHNMVKLVDGRFYNDEGDLTAHWNSAAVRIDEENSRKGIVYLRECRVHARDPQSWFHGYGDMWFEGSNDLLSRGYGTFYDLKRDDPEKTLGKSVELRRATNADEVNTMQNGTEAARKSLILRIIRG